MATVDELFNSGRTLSQDEVDALLKFCGEHNLAVDGKPGENNGKEIAVYIVDTWRQRITPATLAVALEKLKDRLTFLSPAESEYNRVVAENPAAAATFMSWFENQKQLVNTGDPGFENGANILAELGGREVNSKTIHEAIGRIKAPTSKFDTRKRPPLHYVPTPASANPLQHKSDGTGFLGKTGVNEPHWKRVQREREERDAANQRSGEPAQSVTVREARTKAEELRGNTHSESEQIGRVFVTEGTEIDWPATLQARLALQRNFQKAQEVRRFVR